MPRAARPARKLPYQVPQHHGQTPAETSYDLPPPMASDEEMRPRLIARLKSLSSPMTDAQIASLVNWYLSGHEQRLTQSRMWYWIFGEGLHVTLRSAQQEELAEAINDEVFEIRLDVCRQSPIHITRALSR